MRTSALNATVNINRTSVSNVALHCSPPSPHYYIPNPYVLVAAKTREGERERDIIIEADDDENEWVWMMIDANPHTK